MFFVPLTGLIMMVTLLSSVSDNVNSAKIISLLKKIISIVLGVLSTVFVGLVTIKGALASSADSVSVKGIKLLAGNTIPIVGGAIGDAYTSVLGSLNLIKGTVGAFGICDSGCQHSSNNRDAAVDDSRKYMLRVMRIARRRKCGKSA